MEINSNLLALAEQAVLARPMEYIISLQYEEKNYWIKRRPHTKKKFWHKLQNILSRMIFMPVFRPTVSTGGVQSLQDEAMRLHTFANNSIAVPAVVILNDSFLVTSDVGIQLHQCLRHSASIEESEVILKQAIQALNTLHTKGFCHGRPSFGDMTIKDQVIYFIDLEENPLSVMNLAQAQARDLWLFLNNAARYCEQETMLTALFLHYQDNISDDTLVELKHLVKRLKPLRIVAEWALKPVMGRDLKSAIKANRALEAVFAKESCS